MKTLIPVLAALVSLPASAAGPYYVMTCQGLNPAIGVKIAVKIGGDDAPGEKRFKIQALRSAYRVNKGQGGKKFMSEECDYVQTMGALETLGCSTMKTTLRLKAKQLDDAIRYIDGSKAKAAREVLNSYAESMHSALASVSAFDDAADGAIEDTSFADKVLNCTIDRIDADAQE
jgi:hypothetical protein